MLNEIVPEAIARFGACIYAFCRMTNHPHMLMQIGEQPIGEIVQRVAMRYSRHRRQQLRTTGHLFERRYEVHLVDAYFLTLLRYIHVNPVKAHIVQIPFTIRSLCIAHISARNSFADSLPISACRSFQPILFSATLSALHSGTGDEADDLEHATHSEEPHIRQRSIIQQIPLAPIGRAAPPHSISSPPNAPTVTTSRSISSLPFRRGALTPIQPCILDQARYLKLTPQLSIALPLT